MDKFQTTTKHNKALTMNKIIRGDLYISKLGKKEKKDTLTLIWVWMNNHIHYKMSDEVTNLFPNFNGATFEIRNG